MQPREESLYPGDWLRIVVEAGPTEEDVRVSLEQVSELIERLRHALRRP